MEKRKNNSPQDNTQMILIGLIALVVIGASGILGAVLELVLGLVFGVIGIVVGLIGGIVGLVVGLIGGIVGLVVSLIAGVLGIGGAILGIVLGTAFIWGPILVLVLIAKSTSGSHDTPKKKKKNIPIYD